MTSRRIQNRLKHTMPQGTNYNQSIVDKLFQFTFLFLCNISLRWTVRVDNNISLGVLCKLMEAIF